MSTIMDARPISRMRSAVFPAERELEFAVDTLAANHYPPDLIGVAIRHGGTYLLTVVASRGHEHEVDALLRESGATLVVGAPELPDRYSPAPHPGVLEDHDLKLPMGRDFPVNGSSPSVSGDRVKAPVLDPRKRVSSFEEVEPGYSLYDALAEADRCLNCPEPSCMQGCPAENHIPDFIAALRAEDFDKAAGILRQTTSFPGICGRVCDKGRQCEGSCVLAKEGGDAVAIGSLERFIADHELRTGLRQRRAKERQAATGRRVAVIGSGPSGLAVAGELALKGHSVTIFEALPVIGGALAWGIPTFRLPHSVLTGEIEFLQHLGVEFRLNMRVGSDPTVEQFFAEGFSAVFLGAGADVPMPMGIPGEDLEGIFTSTEFLSRAKLARVRESGQWKSPIVGQRLAVIGAGNTAMDVAQTAVRLPGENAEQSVSEKATMDVAETATKLGFREVTVVYRRSEADMPARREEIESARDEGVQFRFLTAPVRFIGVDGRVNGMECIEMALGRLDASGRPSPVPKPGSEFVMEVDTVVLALGYQFDRRWAKAAPNVQFDRAGAMIIDPQTGRTSQQGIWAGGDAVNGPDTVVRAMVAGRRAAADIDSYLKRLRGVVAGQVARW